MSFTEWLLGRDTGTQDLQAARGQSRADRHSAAAGRAAAAGRRSASNRHTVQAAESITIKPAPWHQHDIFDF